MKLFYAALLGILLGSMAAFADAQELLLNEYKSRVAAAAEWHRPVFDNQNNYNWDTKLAAYHYDASLVFKNVADLLVDPSYHNTSRKAAEFFRDEYALRYGGVVPGYRNVTGGLTETFIRNGTTSFKTAVHTLAENAAYCRDNTSEDTTRSVLSREVAFCLWALLDDERLGYPARPWREKMKNDALAHINEWFVSRNAPYVQSFMVGLTARSLIRYYEEVSPEPAIREAVTLAANVLWSEYWDTNARSFKYANVVITEQNDLLPAPDVSMLIAPMYAWLGQKVRASQAFNGAVNSAWLGSSNQLASKQFNQFVLWVPDFLRWYQVVSSTPTPTPTATNTPQPTPTLGQKCSIKGRISLLKLKDYVDCRDKELEAQISQ